MKVYAPKYYKDFSCIADRCKHSCCIGWEIDIDADTYAYYQTVPGTFGARLRANIVQDTDAPHFILGERERCPFLNRNGLCDMICTLGEDALCQICADHPRFRNFYADRTEIGLGLCCEAAAALILTREDKAAFEFMFDDGAAEQESETENAFFAFRDRVFAILQDREKPAETRIAALKAATGLTMQDADITQKIRFYLGLEVLDAAWTERLKKYTPNAYTVSDLILEQLMCYFICRHLADGIYDGSLKVRIAFALHAAQFICTLATSEEDFLDIARMYSAEIEYSEENLEKVFDWLNL